MTWWLYGLPWTFVLWFIYFGMVGAFANQPLHYATCFLIGVLSAELGKWTRSYFQEYR